MGPRAHSNRTRADVITNGALTYLNHTGLLTMVRVISSLRPVLGDASGALYRSLMMSYALLVPHHQRLQHLLAVDIVPSLWIWTAAGSTVRNVKKSSSVTFDMKSTDPKGAIKNMKCGKQAHY